MRPVTVSPTLAVLLLVGGAVLPGCSQSRSDPKDQVSSALKSANIAGVKVDYDRKERVVHLKGKVDSRAERARAEQVAGRAVGTSGKVLNEVTVNGVDDQTADDNDGRITDRLQELVDRDAELKKDDIGFKVNNGAVEVTGTVASRNEKARVTEIARSVDGVREIANGLEVKPSERR
jgi:osmotically-inducible protein OsmY